MVVGMLVLLLLVLLALGAYRFFAGYPRPPVTLHALAPREYATIGAAALATYPRGGAIPPSGLDASVPLHVDRFVAAQRPGTRLLMRLLFVLSSTRACCSRPAVAAASGASPRSTTGSRSSTCAAGSAARCCRAGWCSWSLRAILTMGYFADPGVLRALGLAPRRVATPVCEADLLWPRIGELPATIRHRPGDVTQPAAAVPLGFAGALHPDYEERAS